MVHLPSRIQVRYVLGLLLLSLIASLLTSIPPLDSTLRVHAYAQAENPDLVILLDRSGSMAWDLSGIDDREAPVGDRRIDYALQALRDTYEDVTADGASIEVAAWSGECNFRFDRIWPDWVVDWETSPTIEPHGGTPTAKALQAALFRLGYIDSDGDTTGTGGGTILLISDGQTQCATPDPCTVATAVEGVVKVHTIGFALTDNDPRAAQELRCIADATGGVALTVDSYTELVETLDTLTSVEVLIEISDDGASIVGESFMVNVTVRRTDARSRQVVGDARLVARGPASILNVLEDRAPLRPLHSGESVVHEFAWNADACEPLSRPIVFSVESDQLSRLVELRTTVGELFDRAKNGIDRLAEQCGTAIGAEGRQTRVVILGDSFSSGEGSGLYQGVSNWQGANECRRGLTYGTVNAKTIDHLQRWIENYGEFVSVGDRLDGPLAGLPVGQSNPYPEDIFACSGGNIYDLFGTSEFDRDVPIRGPYMSRYRDDYWDYPVTDQAREPSTLFGAALTSDHWKEQADWMPSQLAMLERSVLAESRELDDLVILLSIGGNDVNAPGLAAECWWRSCIGGRFAATVFASLGEQWGETDSVLDQWYSGLTNELRDTFALLYARVDHLADSIVILAIPYPNPFEGCSSAAGQSRVWQWNEEELRVLNDLADRINGAVRLAVDETQRLGVPVVMVPPVEDRFIGHALCDGHRSLFTGLKSTGRHESLHPNVAGYGVLWQAITEYWASIGIEADLADIDVSGWMSESRAYSKGAACLAGERPVEGRPWDVIVRRSAPSRFLIQDWMAEALLAVRQLELVGLAVGLPQDWDVMENIIVNIVAEEYIKALADLSEDGILTSPWSDDQATAVALSAIERVFAPWMDLEEQGGDGTEEIQVLWAASIEERLNERPFTSLFSERRSVREASVVEPLRVRVLAPTELKAGGCYAVVVHSNEELPQSHIEFFLASTPYRLLSVTLGPEDVERRVWIPHRLDPGDHALIVAAADELGRGTAEVLPVTVIGRTNTDLEDSSGRPVWVTLGSIAVLVLVIAAAVLLIALRLRRSRQDT